MSANLENIEQSFSEQLSDFDRKLREQDDNAALLKDIHTSITALMAQTGERDDEIREILQKRYNGGKLRLDTYQLVRNVLDRVVLESMATMPDAVDDADDLDSRDDEVDEPSYGDTTVINAIPSITRASPQDHLQVGSVLRDRFLLQERVAGGSMGVVYKALDRRIAEADGFDPWVAIKVLSPKLSKNGHALRALQQEAAKGRCLSHPNIVRFIDLDRDDDMYFIVMEWLEGHSLAAILDENKNQSIDRTTSLDIVRQVGLALDYAHRCGVVHADVKPANVMITPSGQVKLFDFGIARIRQKQHQSRKDFDPGVLGAITPAYSSMQVLTGEDPMPADDVFSLGCLMYRLVAGHRVFGPRNAAEAAEQGMEPQRPHGLSDTQWRALKKTLAFSRVSRFATPAEFLAALDAEEPHPIRTHDPIVVEPKPTTPAPRRPWGIAAVLLVAFAAVVVFVSRPELLERVQTSATSLLDRVPGPMGEPAEETAVAGVPATAAPGDGQDGDVTADDGLAGQPLPNDGVAPPQTAEEAIEIPRNDPLTDLAETVPSRQQPQVADRATQQQPLREGPIPNDRLQASPDQAGSTPAAAEAAGRQRQDPAQAPASGAPPQPTSGTASNDLPPPTLTVPLGAPGSLRVERDLTLREDSEAAVIELVRQTRTREPLTVLVEEVGFSGNRSPLTTGRYQLSDHLARFGAGQTTSRIVISMPSDTLREADRQATLLMRNAENSTSHFAIVNLTLEDDDQRVFESGLPPNTLGFSESRVFVGERDPAVQIDVLRFNPGDAPLEVRYFISGGTAVEGEDYFVPGATGLVFGPGQRSARLLIPLVQDAIAEGEESFTLELRTDSSVPQANVYRQITIIMQDDDSAF